MKATKKQSQGQESPQLRVAAYLRVSTEEQAESGLGLDAQLERVNGMAMAKGWPQPAIYEDAGVSGMIEVDERKDGARLIADIASGQVNAVIVASLDRIGRRAIIILNFIATTKEATLVSAKESIDTSNAIGRFMVTIMAGLAEMERDTISERTVAALEARGRTVGIKAGLPPYGYRYDTELVQNGSYTRRDFHGVLVNEQEAANVRYVHELRDQGLSYRGIAAITHIPFTTIANIVNRKASYQGGQRGESDQTWPIILE